jgi:hypothetical protein
MRGLSDVRWSPKLEKIVEEIIMNTMFDFAEAAKELAEYLNAQESAKNSDNRYEIDSNELQTKWTDIEVRLHVLPKMEEEQKLLTNDYDDFPPELEEPEPEVRTRAA